MKKLLALLLAAALLLSLCACKKSDEAVQRPVLAFVHRAAEESEYVAGLEEGFRNSADRLGYDCSVVRPENDSAEAQVALIEDLIEKGVRGIALNANQQDGMEEVLKKAQDAGIPVVTVAADTKGSDLLVQPSTPELVGESLMDAMLELTGGEGKFIILSGTQLPSGRDPWVEGMQVAAQKSKYDNIAWEEINYDYNESVSVEEMKTLITGLMEKYPDVEAICCTGTEILVACCQAVERFGPSYPVTGMGEASQMKDLVGADRACPFYFFWNPNEVGSCAAYALEALRNGAILEDNGELETGLGKFQVFAGSAADFYMVVGNPFCYGTENRNDITDDPEPTEEPIEQVGTVFDIENIIWISFYGYYGNGTASDVPSEYMTEAIKWLNTFQLGEKASEPLPPGTNTYHVEIVYADGTVVESGLDVIEVDGTLYNVTHDTIPDCILEVMTQSEIS